MTSQPPPAESTLGRSLTLELAKIGRYVRSLQERKFFGKLTLSFQGGKLGDLRVEEVKKLDDLE